MAETNDESVPNLLVLLVGHGNIYARCYYSYRCVGIVSEWSNVDIPTVNVLEWWQHADQWTGVQKSVIITGRNNLSIVRPEILMKKLKEGMLGNESYGVMSQIQRVCSYNGGYVPGEKWYVCKENQPAILCAACALSCHDSVEVFEVQLPNNIDVRCDCGNERCHQRFCYFFPGPGKGNTNNPNLYNFGPLDIRYVFTEDDERKFEKFRTDNPRLLLRKAAFCFENKEYIEAIVETRQAMLHNLDGVSTIVSEMALEEGTLALMIQMQEDFLKAIEDFDGWVILKIAMLVKSCFMRSVEILQLARNKVVKEGRENLELLTEHFNSTVSPLIMEALHTKAASFDPIKVFSRGQYRYYLKYVDVKRETKARLYLGNLFRPEYDWMRLAEEAGSDGFYIQLCTDFENQLSDEEDEVKREGVKKHLTKNKW